MAVVFTRIAGGMEGDKRAAIGIRAMPFFPSVLFCVCLCRLAFVCFLAGRRVIEDALRLKRRRRPAAQQGKGGPRIRFNVSFVSFYLLSIILSKRLSFNSLHSIAT